ncbi:MAG: hypothetical protein O3A08_02830 [Proteobacteria bacterium]|nr:hypothetical protein [Pseudomonadota bacterium]MDA1285361.1 hypothetical protein [Pseudomonadota bacterium]
MSIWIFDPARIKPILGLIIVTSLAACGSKNFPSPAKPQGTTITVGGKSLVIAGPSGFCMDRSVSQIRADTAFVLLGNCAVVAPQNRGPQPKVKALLTATIAENLQGPVTETATDMDSFFRSEAGRTALSRASDPGTVRVLDSFESGGTYFLRSTDSSPGIVPDAAADNWRGYFDVDGQLISVSVIGFNSDPITPEASLDTARAFARAIQISNGNTISTASAEPAIAPQTEPEPTAAKSRYSKAMSLNRVGILRRIFW